MWEYRAHPTPAVRAVFQNWLASGISWRVAKGLEALLAEGDSSALSLLAANPAVQWAAIEEHALGTLKESFTNADPVAVSLLSNLAGTEGNYMELRIAAASALCRIHTRQALPVLAGLLDSTNQDLRVLGVGGLSMFANHVPIGSHEPAAGPWRWRTDQTIAHSGMVENNAAFWRAWWTANQAALSQ